MTPFVPPTRLGVGLTYQRGLRPVFAECPGLIDFFEVSPDLLCREHGPEGGALRLDPKLLAEALDCCAGRPVVVHGLGLSIGSAAGWNEGYLTALDRFHSRRAFAWHSEHLGFLTAAGPGGRPLHAGVPLPLPFTEEALDLLAPRAAALGRRYGVPFLIENLTYYLPGLPADGGRDEVAFLNDLAERSGCGLLLDLYNFHCNAVNFDFDPFEALGRLRLDRVAEVHLAGGAARDGFLLDVHSDAVPEPVWALFEWVAPRAPRLAGVVYELMEQALKVVGVDGVRRQLERVRQVWGVGRRAAGGVYAAG
jgi:uncharacterized protein